MIATFSEISLASNTSTWRGNFASRNSLNSTCITKIGKISVLAVIKGV